MNNQEGELGGRMGWLVGLGGGTGERERWMGWEVLRDIYLELLLFCFWCLRGDGIGRSGLERMR